LCSYKQFFLPNEKKARCRMKMKVSLCPICSSVINHKFLTHHFIIYRMKWIGGAKEWGDKGMFWTITCRLL
jgi:hypothetical protein